MKKLVILLMVVLISSWASAAMLYFSTADEVKAGATITINITGDEAANAFGVGAVSLVGAFDSASITTAVLNANFNGLKTAGTLRDGATANVWIAGISAVDNPGEVVSAAEVWGSFTFMVKAGALVGDTIVIDDYKGTIGSPRKTTFNGVEIPVPAMEALTLTVVPEPMTVMLLGLGGLFLRRRKA